MNNPRAHAASRATARETVERYYELIDNGEVEAIDTFVVEHFSADSFVHRPESLRGGGRLDGLERVRRFSTSAAKHSGGPGAMRIGTVLVDPCADGWNILVELHFRIGDNWSRAMEWWTFHDGKATGIQAFYWDTAAMLAPASANVETV
ncbi:nuclear transport factor 2 family protein [Rhodococcus sp. IEGM 1305]|uniref:nuclear transport factor 2 family protein n=1 Tax=Rhodococcus sp. IEGM 1305 TaxID=3047092 RepID=UPI0024B66019|nr:nuclear transport factor 2 family protein [Rhodococcus sp. IEGM 1305]MDI9953309.1 nuclear transport factor 2 family protein [Rhodococcus sp. IEGM 1305]